MSRITETPASRKMSKNEDRKLELLMSMYHKLSLRKVTQIALSYGVIAPNTAIKNLCAIDPETDKTEKA